MGLKKIFALCIALGIIVAFIGCKPVSDTNTETVHDYMYSFIYPVQNEDKIVGTWSNEALLPYYTEKYEISNAYFKSSGSYEGSTTYVRYTSENSGYIYFKYTKAYKSLTESPWYEYSESAPDVGKWYCVSFKNLKANSISISGAYKANGKTSTETLEEAVKEFTIDNSYFAIYSECELQS